MSDEAVRVHLYFLCEPGSLNYVRYVGKTIDPKKRFTRHISDAKMNRFSNYKDNWLRSLLKQGLLPEMHVFGNTTWDHSSDVEIECIRMFREICNLTNGTDGGDGCLNVVVSEETRKRQSKAQKGRVVSEAAREKLRLANIGKKHSEEHKRKISEGGRGRKPSQKMIEKLIERNKSDKMRAASSANMKKYMASLTDEDRSSRAKIASDAAAIAMGSMSKEWYSERSKRTWESRRRNEA
jgi:hypothetical protein